MTHLEDADAGALLAPWSGPFGGLPPFDKAIPALIERAYVAAIDRKRAEIRLIASNPAPPTFENTIAALEDSGRELQRVDCLYRVFARTKNLGEMGKVEQRLAPLMPALEDEIAHDDLLFARVDQLFASPDTAELSQEQQRLIGVIHDRFLRHGADLSTVARARLAEINGRLAELEARFNQNLIAEQDAQAVFIDLAAELEGLSESVREAASAAAKERGRAGSWAVPNTRQAVWPVLTWAARRDLRERVWRMWTQRGCNSGENDNRPIVNEILRLRGEKAKLLGFEDFAHLALADRMAETPQTALSLMQAVWARILGPTNGQLAQLQALAQAEGGTFRLAPWDRLYYAERLRKSQFGLDAAEVKNYLKLHSMVEAMFWAAGRLHGLSFTPLADVPVCSPDIEAFEVSRFGVAVGVLYLDIFARPGKARGSWEGEYRPAESFRGRVLPISSVNCSFERPADGGPVLLSWEQAGILFHELGHALHVLSCTVSYPTLGCNGVAWDAVELPSLLNERWLLDRDLLNRFARHHETGEPMPPDIIEAIEQGAQFDRGPTLTVEFLGAAIVDMRVHTGIRDADFDAVQFEQEVLRELGMPEALDVGLPLSVSTHLFGSQYAAGLYSYLWGDVMAADVAEAFAAAPGGFYDDETNKRWRRTFLEVGSRVPATEAFRNFLGREPQPDALFRRFGLENASPAMESAE